MSWRISSQPEIAHTHAAARSNAPIRTPVLFTRVLFILHLGDVVGIEALQKFCSAGQIKLWIARLDTNEKLIGRGTKKTRHVEHRMMRTRQPVQGNHAENRRKRCAEYRQF